jgi:hypothetical protein
MYFYGQEEFGVGDFGTKEVYQKKYIVINKPALSIRSIHGLLSQPVNSSSIYHSDRLNDLKHLYGLA